MDTPIQEPMPGRSQIGGFLEGHESTVDEDNKVRFGLLLYILNDVILAIFFIGSYIFLRGYDNNLRWFPPGTGYPPYVAGFWIMLLAVIGAALMLAGDLVLNRDQQTLFRVLITLAMLFFLLDLIVQIYVMGHLPFTTLDGAFAMSYIVLSGYHVYHMLLGVYLGVGGTVRAWRGIYNAPLSSGVSNVTTEVAGLRINEETATAARDDPESVGLHQHANTMAPRVLSYYFVWAAIYAIAFWVLVIIQPPYHP